MKSLSSFILEELNSNSITLKNLQATYIGPKTITIQVPKSYVESDIQIYLNDIWLDKLPGGKECDASDLFGSNIKNITDAEIEWEKIDTIENGSAEIEWDSSYDTSKRDDEMQVVQITNISYIIEFSQFVLESVTEETYEDKLNDIFNNTISDEYEYPFEITINTSDIIYRK